jgi:hypothetical protein
MKITKSQLKQIIKEELNEMKPLAIRMGLERQRKAAAAKQQEAAGRSEDERFTGGSIDIEPLSDDEHTASTEAYTELYDVLLNSDLPGDKPSDKLRYALRWIAKFEQGGPAAEEPEPEEKEYDPADSPFTRPPAARYR